MPRTKDCWISELGLTLLLSQPIRVVPIPLICHQNDPTISLLYDKDCLWYKIGVPIFAKTFYKQVVDRKLVHIGHERQLITTRTMNTRSHSLSKARMSCMGCRDQKLKCDRSQPRCSRCTKRDDKCIYPTTRRRQTEPRRTIPELETRLGKAIDSD